MTSPFGQVIERAVPAVSTAGNSDDSVLGQAPFTGTVSAVQYVPEAAITGAATNNRTVSLVNKGQAGSGTTTIATLTFGSGTNATANNEVAVTLSGTAADLVITEGDTLQWRSVANGTGIADPGGVAKITINRTYA